MFATSLLMSLWLTCWLICVTFDAQNLTDIPESKVLLQLSLLVQSRLGAQVANGSL